MDSIPGAGNRVHLGWFTSAASYCRMTCPNAARHLDAVRELLDSRVVDRALRPIDADGQKVHRVAPPGSTVAVAYADLAATR